jgi:glutathione synthase/RimK-type ligase-like ATP-grasp enzyme
MKRDPLPPGRAFMPPILRRLAPVLGAVVEFEPGYEVVGLIRFPNGRQSYFWHNKFNLNSVASARIAQDKGYATYFLKQHGFRVPESAVFLEDAFRGRIACGDGTAAARAFAKGLGWQVFLKPLRGSGGAGIVRACSEREYDAVVPVVFARNKKVQLQRACAGRDFRIVVLDGQVINAYERLPLTVTGDGTRSIGELLATLQQEFTRSGRDTIIPVDDPRIAQVLRRHGISPSHVLPAGGAMPLLDVANLSCGGTTRVVTDRLHPETAALAARVAAAMDLRLAGVDILLASPSEPPADYTVLEVNSAPGLDHYGASGPDHEAHVDELYLKVLTAIANGSPQC